MRKSVSIYCSILFIFIFRRMVVVTGQSIIHSIEKEKKIREEQTKKTKEVLQEQHPGPTSPPPQAGDPEW